MTLPGKQRQLCFKPRRKATNVDSQMQLSQLESKSANVYLAYRRRDKDEFGPAISAVDVSTLYQPLL
jgi:hypothetical protein